MAICANCARETPQGFPRCANCGAPLSDAPQQDVQERKVVSVLFCDLVGFTAQSEKADPEDVNRMLGDYFAAARKAIEAFGGVVEKFIGDAVVGVFGVPAAHEDDPERAVRAALRIIEMAETLHAVGGDGLRLRVGVNTGEALVRLNVEPGSSHGFLAGDAVNTAARIQSVAPEMAVLVGLATYVATVQVFDYEELPKVSVKGKSEPMRLFHARSPLARLGSDLTRQHNAPYVGRATDLGLLKGLFDKSVETDSAQLVTVVGEPGIGKSRIVAELLAHAQEREPRLTWRQGRCLPYGDGTTFWALGEIVKAHTGILETDDRDTATMKLEAVLSDRPDRDWLRQRLLPLVGVEASSKAEREELFAAWQTFLETVAEQTPTVLVFDDIHWADDAMLAFLEHLADHVEGVPLLIVCTSRPELFDRRASFASTLHNANRINLAPLREAETAALVAGLLDTPAISDDLRARVVERAEGNPLYVEELLRLFRDQRLLLSGPDGWTLVGGAELPLPGSIHALIAARLDTLPYQRKALLADAAVVGKVFWAGAVAQMGDRDAVEVAEAFRELSRKELVRVARRSTMAGETEYSFWHMLTRDVAYAQIPRSSRSARHVAAAKWLEAKAGGRVEDIAEVLAHHYATALELAKAAGETERATDLEAPALRFLELAGERSLNLDVAAAVADFERALALAPAGHAARPDLQMRKADALRALGRLTEAVELIEQAMAQFDARGDGVASSRALVNLATCLGSMGQLERPRELVSAALERLEPFGPGEALVAALRMASFLADQGDPRKVAYEARALEMAEELGLAERRIEMLAQRGLRRVNEGDEGGIHDMRTALVAALDVGASTQAARIYDWLVFWLTFSDGHAAALELADEGIDFARRRAMWSSVTAIRADRLVASFARGEWALVAAEADELIEEGRARGNLSVVFDASIYKVAVLSLRGRVKEAGELAGEFLERESGPLDPTSYFVAPRVRGLRSEGAQEAALALLVEWVEATSAAGPGGVWSTYLRLWLARESIALGRIDLARSCAAGRPISWAVQGPAEASALRAIIDAAEGRIDSALAAFRVAADAWRNLDDPYETAMAELGEGQCLIQLGLPAEAEIPLRAARERFARLEAVPDLAEVDSLLTLAATRHGGAVAQQPTS